MEHIRDMLRGLLARALSHFGCDAPGLLEVVIEPAVGRFPPRLGLVFDNGFRTWTPVQPTDFYVVCERYAAWDVSALCRALLYEAHAIWEQMRAEHLAQFEPPRRSRGVAAAWLDRLRGRRVRQGRAREREAGAVDVRSRLRAWWEQQAHEYPRPGFFAYDLTGEIGSKRAQERGVKLLRENLAPPQRAQYDRHGYFDVTGGRSGKRYRIRHGRQMNIEQLDKNGRRVCGWCFYPQGSLVAGDVMLAQKVALELFEADALKIANRF